MAGTLLLGYDVESVGPQPVTGPFLTQMQRLHRLLNAPATLYLVGRTLEQWVPDLQEIARDPLFDIQQHTYSHKLLKTVYIDDGTSIRVKHGISIEEIRDEVHRGSSLIHHHLGCDVNGLTGPWCYYRGLRDRPDILQVLWEEGIRFTRTDGRNAQDWHPVSMDLQPYWYEHLGFPDILEIPIHGWHDCVIRGEVLGWKDLDGYIASLQPYIDRAAERDEVFSLVQHDWSSIREDSQLHTTEAMIRYAQGKGVRLMTAFDYHRERLAEKTAVIG